MNGTEAAALKPPASLARALGEAAARVESMLDQLLPVGPVGAQARLDQAMRYATLGGGKRLRAFLTLETAGLFDVPTVPAERVAAAIEMLHAYSLVHDDLPAMDDDDLRRGKPTCHKAFDEATAILAGDALQARAFGVLAEPPTHFDATVRAELVATLAESVGTLGMAGGQMLDLAAEAAEAPLDLDATLHLESLKTGRLIGYACEAGAILGQAGAAARVTLREFGREVGLAFQIADDLLDESGDETQVGKRLRKDSSKHKATLVSLMGVPRARAEAQAMIDGAIRRLEPFGDRAELLREAARFVIERRT
jgi:farnesyl diphosphate synthase